MGRRPERRPEPSRVSLALYRGQTRSASVAWQLGESVASSGHGGAAVERREVHFDGDLALHGYAEHHAWRETCGPESSQRGSFEQPFRVGANHGHIVDSARLVDQQPEYDDAFLLPRFGREHRLDVVQRLRSGVESRTGQIARCRRKGCPRRRDCSGNGRALRPQLSYRPERVGRLLLQRSPCGSSSGRRGAGSSRARQQCRTLGLRIRSPGR